MKRSQRLFRDARANALQAATAIMIGTASACWVPGAIIANNQGASPMWMFTLILTAIICGIWAAISGREAVMLYRFACEEELHESRRAIRPRI